MKLQGITYLWARRGPLTRLYLNSLASGQVSNYCYGGQQAAGAASLMAYTTFYPETTKSVKKAEKLIRMKLDMIPHVLRSVYKY